MIDEGFELTEDYVRESEILLKTIAKREEMVGLLKRAKREILPEIRLVIARLDRSIERTERILELLREKYFATIEAEKIEAETLEMAETIQRELRAYIAKNEPEKLELLDAMLSDDDKTH